MRRLTAEDFEQLSRLQTAYKAEIGEEPPAPEDLERLKTAIETGEILFYGHEVDAQLVACCSVSRVFSTFLYEAAGVFEDFYILPAYRRRGIARQLAQYAFSESDISSMTVGCADCDLGLYRAIGFRIRLGNLLAFGED